MTAFLQPIANARMTSREVAELTGKRHDNVLRDIREMIDTLHSSKVSFVCESAYYTANNGQQYEMLQMDKETTICLLTGYDAVSRMKVVQRWQALENQHVTLVPRTLPDALRAYALEIESHSETKKKLDEAQPAVDFYNQVAQSPDAMPVAEAAKLLGMGPIKLFAFLRQQKIFMDKSGGQHRNMPYQKYIDAGYFTVVEQSWQAPDGTTHVNVKPMVYQKGLDYIRKRLSALS